MNILKICNVCGLNSLILLMKNSMIKWLIRHSRIINWGFEDKLEQKILKKRSREYNLEYNSLARPFNEQMGDEFFVEQHLLVNFGTWLLFVVDLTTYWTQINLSLAIAVERYILIVRAPDAYRLLSSTRRMVFYTVTAFWIIVPVFAFILFLVYHRDETEGTSYTLYIFWIFRIFPYRSGCMLFATPRRWCHFCSIKIVYLIAFVLLPPLLNIKMRQTNYWIENIT